MFPCSRKEGIETAISNFNSLEKLKQFRYSTNPEKSGVLVIENKKKKVEQVKGRVKNGEIQRVSKYKYLGEWYSEKGDHALGIQKRKEKIEYLTHEIMKYGSIWRVGNMALQVR